MKKYKLIKKYPSLCGDIKEGDIFSKEKNGNCYYGKSLNHFVYDFEIENYPEFWEEIIEKDYEILSFSSKEKFQLGKILTVKEIDYIRNRSNTPYLFIVDRYIDSPDTLWNIYSVKRLSDGEIFTVGDKVHLTNGNYYGFELKEFKFFHNGENGHLKKHRNKTFLKFGIISDLHKEPTFFYLEDIKKTIKKPLFTTEDGVDIFEGDEVFGVEVINNYRATPSMKCKIQPTHLKNHCIYFSTKEAAEEYIIMNKPKFSINNVIEGLFKHKPKSVKTLYTNKLKKLYVKNIK